MILIFVKKTKIRHFSHLGRILGRILTKIPCLTDFSLERLEFPPQSYFFILRRFRRLKLQFKASKSIKMNKVEIFFSRILIFHHFGEKVGS